VNAGKYISALSVIIATYYWSTSRLDDRVYVMSYAFNTIYCMMWDYFMDWGVFMGTKPGYKLLRDKLKYPHYFYFIFMVLNFFLRFAWVATLLPTTMFKPTFNDMQGINLILSVMEFYRRSQWSLLRVENENVNNFEKYRISMDIPTIQVDSDGIYVDNSY